MNLHLKQAFATKAFEIFSAGNDLNVIVNKIEGLMTEHGLSYSTANATSTITTATGNTYTVTARDRFEAALDADVFNVQHMKAIVSEHINFLQKSVQASQETMQKQIADLKAKRGLAIRRKYHENYKCNEKMHNGIIDGFTAKIREMESTLNHAC